MLNLFRDTERTKQKTLYWLDCYVCDIMSLPFHLNLTLTINVSATEISTIKISTIHIIMFSFSLINPHYQYYLDTKIIMIFKFSIYLYETSSELENI